MTKLALLFLTGCGLVQFDVSQELPEQTIEGSLLGGILPSFVPNPISLDIDVKAETQKRNTGPATKVQLKSMKLQLTAGSNFDFLDDVHVFIAAPGLPRVEICDALNIADGLTELNFRVTPELDLLPYVNAGADLTATASGTQPREETSFTGSVTITVLI